jgi:chromosome segregation ATPase
MKTSYRHGLVCFALLIQTVQGSGTEAAVNPATGSQASLEAIVGRADGPIGSASGEIRQRTTELSKLKELRSQLMHRLGTVEAGTSTVEPSQKQAELDALHSGIPVFDQQIALIDERIKHLQSLEAPAAANPAKAVTPATVANVPPSANSVTLSHAVQTIPADKIKSAGTALIKASVIDVAAARKAATGLLTTSHPGYTSMDVDQLAQMVLMQASQDAQTDLQAEMDALKRQNADKGAMRAAIEQAKEQKDSPAQTLALLSTRLRLFQDRYDKTQKALADLMKKDANTSSSLISNKK